MLELGARTKGEEKKLSEANTRVGRKGGQDSSGLVTLHVKGEMVASAEASSAHETLEWFGSGVLAHVPGQLIAPGEPPVAALPVARVRFLTCMGGGNMGL